MVAEKTSVDEIIAVLKVKSFEEQMRVIAALSKDWAEAKVSVPRPSDLGDNYSRNEKLHNMDEPILDVITQETDAFSYKVTDPQEQPTVEEVKPLLKIESNWDSEAELTKISEEHRKKYGEVGDSWKELAGAWKDSTPDNLMELIRADRGPEKEPPNFDE